MALAGGVELPNRLQLLVLVLSNAFEQPVPGSPARGLGHGDQGLVDEAREHLDRQPGRHRGRGLRVKSAHADREAAQCRLLRGIEELVAPLDGRAYRPVAGRRQASPAERPELPFQASEDLLQRHRGDAGGGKLDGQRKAIQPFAQLGDRRVRALAWHEVRPALAAPLHEEPSRLFGLQRVEPPDALAAHVEHLAAGGQEPDALARAEQGGGELGASVDDMLAVVEDEQEVPVGQKVA